MNTTRVSIKRGNKDIPDMLDCKTPGVNTGQISLKVKLGRGMDKNTKEMTIDSAVEKNVIDTCHGCAESEGHCHNCTLTS